MSNPAVCPLCHGEGKRIPTLKVEPEECNACEGKGVVWSPETSQPTYIPYYQPFIPYFYPQLPITTAPYGGAWIDCGTTQTANSLDGCTVC